MPRTPPRERLAASGRNALKKNSPTWIRLSGSGMELALITIAMGYLGSVIDNKYELDPPLGIAAGGLLGFSLGMVRFIRLAISVSETEQKSDQNRISSGDSNDCVPEKQDTQ